MPPPVRGYTSTERVLALISSDSDKEALSGSFFSLSLAFFLFLSRQSSVNHPKMPGHGSDVRNKDEKKIGDLLHSPGVQLTAPPTTHIHPST